MSTYLIEHCLRSPSYGSFNLLLRQLPRKIRWHERCGGPSDSPYWSFVCTQYLTCIHVRYILKSRSRCKLDFFTRNSLISCECDKYIEHNESIRQSHQRLISAAVKIGARLPTTQRSLKSNQSCDSFVYESSYRAGQTPSKLIPRLFKERVLRTPQSTSHSNLGRL